MTIRNFIESQNFRVSHVEFYKVCLSNTTQFQGNCFVYRNGKVENVCIKIFRIAFDQSFQIILFLKCRFTIFHLLGFSKINVCSKTVNFMLKCLLHEYYEL